MTLPNFLIIGAAKSGTTSLANYLKQHPQVFIPPGNKEPNFFIVEGLKLPPFAGPAEPKILYEKIYRYSVTDLDSYRSLFRGVTQEKAIGEASVPYLYFPQAAKRIKKHIPDVKMIVVLRNPVDRLYSHYLMVREKYLLEPLRLAQALAQEEERIHNNWGWDWHYVSMGMYYKQLKLYLDIFGSEPIKVFLYEDFCLDPVGVVQEMCQHIDVDDTFIPNLSERNKVSYASKSLRLNRLLNTPNQIRSSLKRLLPTKVYKRFLSYGSSWNKVPIPPLAPDIRTRLKALFREDIIKLQELINRDLSAWL